MQASSSPPSLVNDLNVIFEGRGAGYVSLGKNKLKQFSSLNSVIMSVPIVSNVIYFMLGILSSFLSEWVERYIVRAGESLLTRYSAQMIGRATFIAFVKRLLNQVKKTYPDTSSEAVVKAVHWFKMNQKLPVKTRKPSDSSVDAFLSPMYKVPQEIDEVYDYVEIVYHFNKLGKVREFSKYVKKSTLEAEAEDELALDWVQSMPKSWEKRADFDNFATVSEITAPEGATKVEDHKAWLQRTFGPFGTAPPLDVLADRAKALALEFKGYKYSGDLKHFLFKGTRTTGYTLETENFNMKGESIANPVVKNIWYFKSGQSEAAHIVETADITKETVVKVHEEEDYDYVVIDYTVSGIEHLFSKIVSRQQIVSNPDGLATVWVKGADWGLLSNYAKIEKVSAPSQAAEGVSVSDAVKFIHRVFGAHGREPHIKAFEDRAETMNIDLDGAKYVGSRYTYALSIVDGELQSKKTKTD
jgi:hypothetical protein